MGPYAVTRNEYNFGDTAFTPVGFPGPVEVRASVHYPTSLLGGPFPLVVFLHGRHATCYSSGSAFLEWPCTPPRQTIPSFQGYDYTGSVLASHGYIVVSISANGINARDNSVSDYGAQARAELIQHHLDIWNTFNTTGGAPFGSLFVGHVDLTNVGTMGHSRGGEGVIRHVLYNRSLGSPYGIRAVFPLAPVDFSRPVANTVNLSVLLPYCDGDVSDLQGVHFYDDARYAVPGDLTPKHTVLVMGANHNFFNTVWTPGSGYPGAADDWTAYVSGGSSDPHCGTGTGNKRLSAAQEQGTGRAYMSGFFRRYLGSEIAFAPMLKGDVPPPPSAMTTAIFPSYQAPDAPAERRDVNRLLVTSHLTTNHLGGAVSQSGITPYDLCGGASPQPQHCLPTQPTSRQPHTTPSALSGARGLSQLRGGWSATTATWTNTLPVGSRDVSAFTALQFRVSVNFDDGRNTGVPQDFTVQFTDGTGAISSALVSSYSGALFYPPGSTGPVPKVVLNSVRIPLTAFPGVNLADVRSIQFRYDQRTSGALLVSDLAFADAGAPSVPPDLVESAVSNPPATAVQGTSFSVTDTVLNQGAGGAGASTTRYYLSLDSARGAGDVLLTGARAVPALGAGASSTGTVSVTVPASTTPAAYFLLACADDTTIIAESNEGNNCKASATTVTVQSSGGGSAPDLVETAVSNPPAGALVGGTFAVTDTVTNQGGLDAVASTTRYYLSLDAAKSSGDRLLAGSRSVPALSPGASSTGTKTVRIKAGTPAGTYFLLACADDTNVVAEGTGEGNNCRASGTTVVVTGPDLVELAVSNPPATATFGGTFSVTDTVKNQGSAASGATTTRYYLSANTTKGSDLLLTGTRAVPSLAVGATSTGTVSVTIPSTTPSGLYYLLACADDSTSTSETNEKNNCRASATRVLVQ